MLQRAAMHRGHTTDGHIPEIHVAQSVHMAVVIPDLKLILGEISTATIQGYDWKLQYGTLTKPGWRHYAYMILYVSASIYM